MAISVKVDTLLFLKTILLLLLLTCHESLIRIDLRARSRIEMLLTTRVIDAALSLKSGSCELYLLLIRLKDAVLRHLGLRTIIVVSLV